MMNQLKPIFLLLLLVPLISLGTGGRKSGKASHPIVDWFPAGMLQKPGTGVRIVGNPVSASSPYGRTAIFNGSSDGIFLEQMPLAGLKRFTVEILLCPASGGNFEQRYFHCGEVRGSRVMMELRSTATEWYLDAFFKSGDQQKTLIESTLLHPLDQWAHVAFVVDDNRQVTFVNGVQELESKIVFQPFDGGRCSVGVRQNELSWFKGAIYRIRITPEVLKPGDFFKY